MRFMGPILAHIAPLSMRFFPMRLLDGELDEEERQEGEHCRLEESDERLEEHKEAGCAVGREERRDRDDDGAGKDVAEEPERERDDTDEFADELDKADRKSDRALERILDELAAVFPDADRDDAGDLDDEERHDREDQGDGEIGIHAAE